MTIRVLSLDFDGCLFNNAYMQSGDKNVITSNQQFLDSLGADSGNYKKTVVMVGSNRQSRNVDIANSYYGKGSCFPAVQKISQYLNVELDPFLLADVYGELKSGTSFKRAIEKDFEGEDADWRFDESKVSILYAQMHKLANENPNEEIVFDFFDDRGKGERRPNDILEWLEAFYRQYPQLMPANVTLRLHHYAGGDVTKLSTIKGTGFIDENYQQTVRDMADICLAKEPYNDGYARPLFVNQNVTPEALINRKAMAVTSTATNIVASLETKVIPSENSSTELPATAGADAPSTTVESPLIQPAVSPSDKLFETAKVPASSNIVDSLETKVIPSENSSTELPATAGANAPSVNVGSPLIQSPASFASNSSSSNSSENETTTVLLKEAFLEAHKKHKDSQLFQFARKTGIDAGMSWSQIIEHAKGNSHKNAGLGFFSRYTGNRSMAVLQSMEILDKQGNVMNDAIQQVIEAEKLAQQTASLI